MEPVLVVVDVIVGLVMAVDFAVADVAVVLRTISVAALLDGLFGAVFVVVAIASVVFVVGFVDYYENW